MHMFLTRACRLIRTSSPRTYAAVRLPQSRALHASLSRRATEDTDSFVARVKDSPLFKQLASKPEALQAISKLVEIMRAKGVDVSSGQPPSAMTMFKLAADKEFRDVAKNVSEELKNAGIDVTNKDTLAEFMRLRDPKA